MNKPSYATPTGKTILLDTQYNWNLIHQIRLCLIPSKGQLVCTAERFMELDSSFQKRNFPSSDFRVQN